MSTKVCDHDEPCACYVEGYTQGKDKAHFEVRNSLDAGHARDCGCEPCLTARHVMRQWFATQHEMAGDPSLGEALEGVAYDYITNIPSGTAHTHMISVLSEDPGFDAEACDAVLRIQADAIASSVMAILPRVNQELLHIIATVLVGHSHQAPQMAESFARDALMLGRLGREDEED
ncbi:MAG: hypothetical protein F4X27_13655 [Chloroflexi bacterium]|nr:hypothetical protein [Chloroflexota bacterium]